MVDGARIESVRTRGFRSVVDSTRVQLTDDITVLVGPNGAGKTNFMESLSYIDSVENISHERPKYQDQIDRSPDPRPVISVQIDNSAVYSDSLRALVEPVSVESVAPTEQVPTLGETVTIERSGSGTHTVWDGRTRRELVELVSLRIEEIRQTAADIAELLPKDPTAVEDARLQERLASYKFWVEDELDDPSMNVDTLRQSEDESGSEEIDNSSSLENINDDIGYLIQKLTTLRNIKDEIQTVVPSVHYFDSQNPIEDEVAIEDIDSSEAYSSLFKIADLSGEEKDPSDYSVSQIEQRLSQAERDLTTLLNEYLSIDEPMGDSVSQAVTDPTDGRYTVEISVEERDGGQFVSLDVSDTAEKGFTTHPTERSTGARWLLSFLLGFIELSFTEDGPGLVVYDDPGLPLHPKWKRQLRRILYAVDTEYQVVYSTHSPFLIRNDQTDQIRIVRNHGASEYGETDDCGTKLFPLSSATGSDYVHDRLDPVRSSLGAPIAESLFGGERNVVVEGPTDRQYLEAFSSLFNDDHERISFDEDTHHMSGNGSNADVLANFLEVEQPSYVVLTDSDSGGRTIRNNMKDSGISTEKCLDLDNTVPNLEVGNPEIEDLFPRELVCQYVAETTDIDQQELLTQARNCSEWAIVDLVETRHDVKFPKKDVARKISGEVDSNWLDPSNELRLAASLNFASLIDTLRSRLDNNI